jgi:serine/threonine protein kinase
MYSGIALGNSIAALGNSKKTNNKPPRYSVVKSVPSSPKFVRRCSKKLGEGNSGAATKECYNPDCTNCRVVKKSLDDDYVSFFREAAIDDRLQTAAKKSKAYEKLVPKFYSFFNNAHKRQTIETSWNPNEGDFKTFLDREFMVINRPQFARFLAQIFCTLAFLHKEVGFVHMDLKCDNVLIITDDEHFESSEIAYENHLPLAYDGKNFMLDLPYGPQSAMVIDFGNGFTDDFVYRNFIIEKTNIYSKGTEFGGECDFQAFDAFRLFVNIYDMMKSYHIEPAFAEFFIRLVGKIFGKFFMKTLHDKTSYNKGYQMLNAKGCKELKEFMSLNGQITYASVAYTIATLPGSGITLSEV